MRGIAIQILDAVEKNDLSLHAVMQEIEQEICQLALEENGNNILKTALFFKMNRTTMAERAKRFGYRNKRPPLHLTPMQTIERFRADAV